MLDNNHPAHEAAPTQSLNTTLIDLEPLRRAMALLTDTPAPPPPQPPIEFFKPTELCAYQPPEGAVLAGDNHLTRGAVFVIGGAPGVGKSRASVALALAGATGQPWLQLPVPKPFRTLIIQNENGRLRLRDEFSGLPCAEMDDWVRVSPPPPYGLAFEDPLFRATLQPTLDDFQPDVVLIDPWNAAARDEKARDYLETFHTIRSLFPTGDQSPAIGIVAHTRKPTLNERTTGRGLLNLLAGSYVLGSVPRSAFILQAASDDPEDDRVVWTCCKNNDGPLGQRTVWHRRNGLFAPCADFDWAEFDSPAGEASSPLNREQMDQIFEQGQRKLSRRQAVIELMNLTGYSESACYKALKLDGPFASHLRGSNAELSWVPGTPPGK